MRCNDRRTIHNLHEQLIRTPSLEHVVLHHLSPKNISVPLDMINNPVVPMRAAGKFMLKDSSKESMKGLIRSSTRAGGLYS